MDLVQGMAGTVAPEMPSPTEVAANRWLTDADLRVYSTEYERTGFQGGLQWYRSASDERLASGLQLFSGRRIDVPAGFIAGRSDCGIHQRPGAYEPMRTCACAR